MRNYLRYAFVILSIVWMVVIFCFSARDATLSTSDSHRVSDWIGKAIYPNYESLSPESRLSFEERIDHTVRKCAHGLEYALLGGLLLGAFSKSQRHKYRFSWGIATLYAVTDEIHQVFIPGRYGHWSDVCIDSAGAFLALFIIFFLQQLIYMVKYS